MARVYVPMYHDYIEEMTELTMEERGRLVTAMLLHARGEAVPEALLTGAVRYLFPRYRLQIDREASRYVRKAQASRENGRKGGRPRSVARKESGEPPNNRPHPVSRQTDVGSEGGGIAENDTEEPHRQTKVCSGGAPADGLSTQNTVPAPPSLDEVLEFCRAEKTRVDGRRFWNYYQSNGWRAGRLPILDWRAKLRDWEASEGNPRPVAPASDVPDPSQRYLQRSYRPDDFGPAFLFDLSAYGKGKANGEQDVAAQPEASQ